jgi:hypothetical protein
MHARVIVLAAAATVAAAGGDESNGSSATIPSGSILVVRVVFLGAPQRGDRIFHRRHRRASTVSARPTSIPAGGTLPACR